MKTLDTLVDDIYNLMSTKDIPDGVDHEAAIESFGENVKDLMRKQFVHEERDTRTLRMSNIGRPDAYLWNVVNTDYKEDIQPHTYVKFLYGHLIEEMLLCLVKLSGHEVSHEQARCEVDGIVGHMDCMIDGVVTDVKSTSTFGFKKFKEGTLAADDPFGYIGQIKGYAHYFGQTSYGWLAMDKQNGHLTYLKYDEENTEHPMHSLYSYSITDRIQEIKKIVAQSVIPSVCYEAIPDGASGNTKLAAGCAYCPYKENCWPTLRTFLYSNGPRYLVTVEKEPKVFEVGAEGGGDF